MMTATLTPEKIIFKKSQRIHLDRIRTADWMTEGEFISLRSAMSRDATFAKTVLGILENRTEGRPIHVGDAQSAKGLRWLQDQYLSPLGKVRKSNPFGERELRIISDYAFFTLYDMQNIGNQYHNWYLPIWRIHAHDASSFAYYTGRFQGDRIVIVD